MKIKFKDSSLISINDDYCEVGGCETCNFGARYISNIQFTFENGNYMSFTINSNLEDFKLSVLDIMEYFSDRSFENISIFEFKENFKEYLNKRNYKIKKRINYYNADVQVSCYFS